MRTDVGVAAATALGQWAANTTGTTTTARHAKEERASDARAGQGAISARSKATAKTPRKPEGREKSKEEENETRRQRSARDEDAGAGRRRAHAVDRRRRETRQITKRAQTENHSTGHGSQSLTPGIAPHETTGWVSTRY